MTISKKWQNVKDYKTYMKRMFPKSEMCSASQIAQWGADVRKQGRATRKLDDVKTWCGGTFDRKQKVALVDGLDFAIQRGLWGESVQAQGGNRVHLHHDGNRVQLIHGLLLEDQGYAMRTVVPDAMRSWIDDAVTGERGGASRLQGTLAKNILKRRRILRDGVLCPNITQVIHNTIKEMYPTLDYTLYQADSVRGVRFHIVKGSPDEVSFSPAPTTQQVAV